MHIHSRVMDHLNTICENGPRLIGSPANKRAAAYIETVFRDCGLTVRNQEFTCPEWNALTTELVVDGTSLEAVVNAFSPSCDVTAHCVPVGTVQELESAVLTGRIALLYGDITKDRWIPLESKVCESESDRRIIQMLEERNPSAIITVAPHRGEPLPVIEDWDFHIPSVTVSLEVGLKLMRTKTPVTLVIVSNRSESEGSNILGTNSTRERIVFCAHYDTKVNTQGAFDNGSGVAVLLTVAELLTEMSVPVEFVAFNDEEYNGLGDFEYARSSEFESIRTVINVDGVGHSLGTHTVTMMENSESYKKVVSSIKEKYPGIVWVKPWPQSNHTTFTRRGVPGVALSSLGLDIAHSTADTLEWMSADKLSEIVMFVADIVHAVEKYPLDWFRAPAKK